MGVKVGEGVLGATLGAAVAVHCTVPVRIPSEQEYEPETVYPLLQVGSHELPLARLPVHGLGSPFVTAAVASHALGLQANVSVNVPSVGASATNVPSVGSSATHTSAMVASATRRETFVSTVSLVIVPAEHDLLPDAVYPLLHVGVHELPIARLDVQLPNAPLDGAGVASQVGTEVDVDFGAGVANEGLHAHGNSGTRGKRRGEPKGIDTCTCCR